MVHILICDSEYFSEHQMSIQVLGSRQGVLENLRSVNDKNGHSLPSYCKVTSCDDM